MDLEKDSIQKQVSGYVNSVPLQEMTTTFQHCGYQCAACGQWVPTNTTHYCFGGMTGNFYPWQVIDNAALVELKAIRELLEKLTEHIGVK